MKLIHRDNYKSYIICLVAFILSAIAFPNLPEQIPIHFNAQGIPDGYGSPLTVFLVLNVFFLLVQLYLITYALEMVTLNLLNIIIVAVGILFIIIGNMLPKVKQNFFMGIKTPWALADEYVWYETHRFSGKLWFILGLIMCVSGFLPGTVSFPIILIISIIAAIVPLVYSYIVYKRRSSK